MTKKILFLGGSSLLAHCWVSNKENIDNIILGTHNRKVDNKLKTTLIDFNNLKKQIKELKVDIVINCVGYTSVENCEINPEKAFDINVNLPYTASKACSELSIKFVHISTDHLFDGRSRMYTELDKVTPLNIYSKTKFEGELKVLEANKSSLVIRTNFFGWGPSYKQSFSDFIYDNLNSKKRISLFSDVYYTPILVSELSRLTEKLIEKKCCGIYNVVSNERISKYDFGIKLCNEFALDKSLISKISIKSRNDLVKRPLEMSLSNKKLKDLGLEIKPLSDQLKELKFQLSKIDSRLYPNKIIPYGRQNISKEDIEAVNKVLNSDFLTQGPVVLNFEKEIANYTKSKFGIAVNSATSALHISCMALGLKENDIVWTSPISFVASANCALYCNAIVDFVDIDLNTYNMSVQSLSEKLKKAKAKNMLPKILIPVHLSGQSCEMKEIYDLSKEYGFKIIEDASHAIGGKYKNEPIGGCKYSDITVFSFHPVKIITTGEGGVCTTNSPEIANMLCRFRSHGITRHQSEMTKKSDGPWYYQQLDLGYNYRMTDIQAALGLSQLKNLNSFITIRHKIARKYNEAFMDKPIIRPEQHLNNYSSYHLYIIRVKNNIQGLTRLDLFNKLREAGILVNIHYIPIYQQPYYEQFAYDKSEFPNSEKYYEQAISLPIHTKLTIEDQDFVIENILNFLSKQKTYIKNTSESNRKGYQSIF